MDALGISIPAFRIAGGLLLFYIAFDMVFALRAERRREQRARRCDRPHPQRRRRAAGHSADGRARLDHRDDAAGRTRRRRPLALAGLMATVALVIAGRFFVVFLAAERVSRWLGATGAVVLSRMLGVVLAALAVQFVIDGVLSVMRAGGG